jgi:hypothetical protein
VFACIFKELNLLGRFEGLFSVCVCLRVWKKVDTDAWNNNPIDPCGEQFRSTDRKVIEHVVLRWTLPVQCSRSFNGWWNCKQLQEFLYSPQWNTYCPPKCESRTGSSLENVKYFIQIQCWTTWIGNMEDKSDPQNRRWCQSTGRLVVGDCRGREPQNECLKSAANWKSFCCDFTVGLPPLEHGESWGRSCLACCYGSTGSTAVRTCRKLPQSWERTSQLNVAKGNSTGTTIVCGWSEQIRIRGIILHC